jgi:hypothetical protein
LLVSKSFARRLGNARVSTCGASRIRSYWHVPTAAGNSGGAAQIYCHCIGVKRACPSGSCWDCTRVRTRLCQAHALLKHWDGLTSLLHRQGPGAEPAEAAPQAPLKWSAPGWVRVRHAVRALPPKFFRGGTRERNLNINMAQSRHMGLCDDGPHHAERSVRTQPAPCLAPLPCQAQRHNSNG